MPKLPTSLKKQPAENPTTPENNELSPLRELAKAHGFIHESNLKPHKSNSKHFFVRYVND